MIVISVTRLGDIWKFLATKFLTKVAQMIGNFLANLKTLVLCKYCLCYFLGNFWKHLGYSYIWSHWSWRDFRRDSYLMRAAFSVTRWLYYFSIFAHLKQWRCAQKHCKIAKEGATFCQNVDTLAKFRQVWPHRPLLSWVMSSVTKLDYFCSPNFLTKVLLVLFELCKKVHYLCKNLLRLLFVQLGWSYKDFTA